MPRKLRQLKADYRKLGFVENERGGKGSHSKWTHPLLPGLTILLAGKDGDDAARIKNEICERRANGCERYPRCTKE